MNFLVPQATLEAVVRYLGQRPYAEVANLVQSIGQCQLDPKDLAAAKKALEAKKKEVEKKVVDIKKPPKKKVPKKTT